MMLLDRYEGHAVVAIHYDELRLLVEAFSAVDPGIVKEIEHVSTLSAAFEAMMYAGRLQTQIGDVTLRQFRAERGMRDWQPEDYLYRSDPLLPRNAFGGLVDVAAD